MTSPITVHIDTPAITIYLTSPDPGDAINRALAPILERIDTMATAQEDFSRELQETKDAVGAAVPAMNAAAETMNSASALIPGLKAALDAAIANGDTTPLVQAAADLDALQAQLASAASGLSGAAGTLASTVTANTPA